MRTVQELSVLEHDDLLVLLRAVLATGRRVEIDWSSRTIMVRTVNLNEQTGQRDKVVEFRAE